MNDDRPPPKGRSSRRSEPTRHEELPDVDGRRLTFEGLRLLTTVCLDRLGIGVPSQRTEVGDLRRWWLELDENCLVAADRQESERARIERLRDVNIELLPEG